MTDQSIIDEYGQKKMLLTGLCEKVEVIIKELLIENKINVHQVPTRVKTLESVRKKIETKQDKYICLADITDVVGIRIIVYLEDDVDEVSKVIQKEFAIDKFNSVDKRKLAIDAFGYKSLHYVASLNKSRYELTENKKFKELKFEIQIRSILQHAWAEIEHDLGYKGDYEIPTQYKRSFHRIAAQLETADLEFVRLKNDLAAYEKAVIRNIKNKPNTVEINKASLTSYLKTSKLISRIDNQIAKSINAQVNLNKTLNEFILFKHGFFNITTIKELDDNLNKYQREVHGFAQFVLKGNNHKYFSIGISVTYLFYYLVCLGEDVNKIEEYLQYAGANVGGPDTAKRLLNSYLDFKKT